MDAEFIDINNNPFRFENDVVSNVNYLNLQGRRSLRYRTSYNDRRLIIGVSPIIHIEGIRAGFGNIDMEHSLGRVVYQC